MRKLIPFAACLTLALAAAGIRAQSVNPNEQQFFDSHIDQLVKLKPTRIDNPALAKVFSCQFYNVEVTIADSGNKVLVARQGSELIQVTKPSTTADMPDFEKLINADFRLKTDEDAHTLQDALDVLYPIDTSFDQEDAQAKTIKHTGNEWTFVRGKFFEHFKGFVFTTNDDGAITNVKYSLDIP